MSTFRKQYRPLDDQEKALLDKLKDAAEALEAVYDEARNGREMSLARTNLEQSVMWAVKQITG